MKLIITITFDSRVESGKLNLFLQELEGFLGPAQKFGYEPGLVELEWEL